MENNSTSNELKNSKENTDNKKKKPRTSLALTDETRDKFNKLFNQYRCIYPDRIQNDFLNDLLEKYNDNEFKSKLCDAIGINTTDNSTSNEVTTNNIDDNSTIDNTTDNSILNTDNNNHNTAINNDLANTNNVTHNSIDNHIYSDEQNVYSNESNDYINNNIYHDTYNTNNYDTYNQHNDNDNVNNNPM